jgi:hypothetical protein
VVGQKPPTSQEQRRVLGQDRNVRTGGDWGFAGCVRFYKSDTRRPVSQRNGTGHQRMAAQAMGCRAEASGPKRNRKRKEKKRQSRMDRGKQQARD